MKVEIDLALLNEEQFRGLNGFLHDWIPYQAIKMT